MIKGEINDKGGDKSHMFSNWYQKGEKLPFSSVIKKRKKFNFNWYLDWEI
jgi:hypothetical protein